MIENSIIHLCGTVSTENCNNHVLFGAIHPMHNKYSYNIHINHCVLLVVKSFNQRNGVPDPCILIPASWCWKGKVPWGNFLVWKAQQRVCGGRSRSIKQQHVALELSVNAKLASSMKLYLQSVCQLAFLTLCCVLITGKNLLTYTVGYTCVCFSFIKPGYSKGVVWLGQSCPSTWTFSNLISARVALYCLNL